MRIFILLFLSISFNSLGLNHFEKGLELYQKKQYTESEKAFLKDWDSTQNSSSLYNIALCKLKQEQDLKALYFFEKTLKYQPNNPEAIFNASQIYSKLNEGDYWQHPYTWMGRFIYKKSTNFWTYLTLFFGFTLSLSIFLLFTQKKSWLRKVSQLSTVFSALLLILIFFITNSSAKHFSNKEYLFVGDTQIKTFISPGKNPTEVNLKKNARYVVRKNSNNHLQITLSKGEKIWVSEEDVLAY